MATSPPTHRLLVVDDEPDLRTLYELTLLRVGYAVESAPDLASARAMLAEQPFDLVITDMRLPDGLGLELVKQRAGNGAAEKTIVITAYGSAENAVEALKAGAFDYLTKPVDLAQLRAAVATALHKPEGQPPSAAPSPQAAGALAHIVGHSAPMVAVRQRVERVARSMAPVLVLGESGTGKELVAKALHACSQRADGPFVAVNCGAIPETLIEAEFFGVRKGAYTGAMQDRAGYFQAASGGTLFLDEIGDLPLAMQAKLLRAIQERQVRPLGSTQEESTDVRIVSATHRDLAQAVRSNQFRQDLFYRLNVIEVRVPPLRERMEDLPLVAQAILHRLAQRNGLSFVPQPSPAALDLLQSHPFPGNVRELENVLERAIALYPEPTLQREAIVLPDLPAPEQPASPQPLTAHARTEAPMAEQPAAEGQMDKAELQKLLHQNRWNQSRTARQLGWTLAKLRYWMQRLKLDDPSGEV